MTSRDEEWSPLRFIGEEITVEFDQVRFPLKKPAAPDRFIWSEREYKVTRVLSAWREYERKGKLARNMQPYNLRMAAKRGSWGVGRFYFRVQIQEGRVFDLYYDRAPDDVSDRLGHWFLLREMQAVDMDAAGDGDTGFHS
jgi:hypothetical protein